MRPPSHFGNDITNTASNDGNNNNNNNGSGDDNNNNNSSTIVARLTEMGATMMFPKIAGRGIIRVVERCDDAKENNNLGNYTYQDTRQDRCSSTQVGWCPYRQPDGLCCTKLI